MEFLKCYFSSFLTGKRRSSIAIFLAMALAFGLVAPPPATAQIGALAVIAAATAVVSLITLTIGALLGASIGILNDINGSLQSLVNLWENVVYPVALINQAQMMVTQLVAQFRGLVTAIDNVNVRRATLPNPIALEAIMRNALVAEFGHFDQVFRTTFQPLLPRRKSVPADHREGV